MYGDRFLSEKAVQTLVGLILLVRPRLLSTHGARKLCSTAVLTGLVNRREWRLIGLQHAALLLTACLGLFWLSLSSQPQEKEVLTFSQADVILKKLVRPVPQMTQALRPCSAASLIRVSRSGCGLLMQVNNVQQAYRARPRDDDLLRQVRKEGKSEN